MYVAIVGSREYPNRKQVEDYVNSLPDDTVIVSGGARGVDMWAQIAAEKRGLKTLIFPADWNRYGRGAGMKRNWDIITHADCVVAFWDGASHGTEHTISLARKAQKPLEVIYATE